MSPSQRTTAVHFAGRLEPVPHGGHFVVVPDEVAAQAGLRYGMRVRGTIGGVPYRSSLARYSGVFHLGIHKATLEEARLGRGDTAVVTLEADREPLPTDVVPPELRRAFRAHPGTSTRWQGLAPSRRREYVRWLIDAKKTQTRERRLARILDALGKDAAPMTKSQT